MRSQRRTTVCSRPSIARSFAAGESTSLVAAPNPRTRCYDATNVVDASDCHLLLLGNRGGVRSRNGVTYRIRRTRPGDPDWRDGWSHVRSRNADLCWSVGKAFGEAI